jgi:prolyl oligopeptidase
MSARSLPLLLAAVLLRVETNTGHGGGTPTSKEIEETTDVFAFLVEALDMDVPAFSSETTSE